MTPSTSVAPISRTTEGTTMATTTTDWVYDVMKLQPLIHDFTRCTPSDCPAQHDGGYWCTRQAGHTGRHAAGTGRQIVAVWTTTEGNQRQCRQ